MQTILFVEKLTLPTGFYKDYPFAVWGIFPLPLSLSFLPTSLKAILATSQANWSHVLFLAQRIMQPNQVLPPPLLVTRERKLLDRTFGGPLQLCPPLLGMIMLIAGDDIGKPIIIAPTPSGGKSLCFSAFVIHIKSDIIVPKQIIEGNLLVSLKVVKGPTIAPNVNTKFWTSSSSVTMKRFQNEGVLKEALL